MKSDLMPSSLQKKRLERNAPKMHQNINFLSLVGGITVDFYFLLLFKIF